MEPSQNQPKEVGTTPQHFHTISTSCVILPCVSCVHMRVIEGSGLGSAGCVVHVDLHAWRVRCVRDHYNAILTEHGRHVLSRMRKLWSTQAVMGLYEPLDVLHRGVWMALPLDTISLNYNIIHSRYAPPPQAQLSKCLDSLP